MDRLLYFTRPLNPLSPVKIKLTSLLALAGLLAPSLWAATSLCDFETDADVARLKWASRGQSQLERSSAFASSGGASLKFTSPTWKQGMPEWPAFEFRPEERDWSGYERLVVDVTNLSAEAHHFAMFASDSKVPFREGLNHLFNLPEYGYRRFIIPLSAFPEKVNRGDITIVHFYAERPRSDLVLHVDQIALLKAGESLPEPGSKLMRELAPLKIGQVVAAKQALDKCRAASRGGSVDGQFAAAEQRLQNIRSELESQHLTMAKLETIARELSAMPQTAEHLAAVARFQKACVAQGQPGSNMLVGLATSMEKVLPRAIQADPRPAREAEISLARHEKESFQVLVLPMAEDLKQVRVTASNLRSATGEMFARGQIACEVVGYVETKVRPPYGTSHIGWWPDPLLDFLGPVDIEAGDVQGFWVRVRCPKNQPPGVYRGMLTVSAQNAPAQHFPLIVRVRSFTMPVHSPLPLAITFAPHDYPADEKQPLQGEYRQSSEYPVNAWKKHKLAWVDMLADYYINYDSLYRSGPPDFEVLKHLHNRGQLVAFNLGIFDAVSRGGTAATNALSGLRAAYDQAKTLNILDHAYIYGFDECKPEMFPLLETTSQTLHREFPGALLMTTSYDHSYGMETVAKTMQAWCPLTPSFKLEQVGEARAAGRQVWWYICCGPHHPHANMFIEYPAIEARLLMGAMTARQRPDGFLYYQIGIWNSQRPITQGPFTDWDPRSWTSYHGDGSWTCAGPDGTPLPTIRLENFRDGLEDYAYAVILEAIVRRREAQSSPLTSQQRGWLALAKATLQVPHDLMQSMTDYSRDPAKLYNWRNQMADLIESSGVDDVNPWGANFGLPGSLTRP